MATARGLRRAFDQFASWPAAPDRRRHLHGLRFTSDVRKVAAAGVAVGLGACGSIVRNASERITFVSDLSCAAMKTLWLRPALQHRVRSTTPGSLDVARSDEFDVAFTQAGYRPKTVPFRIWIAGNGAVKFAGNVIALVPDALPSVARDKVRSGRLASSRDVTNSLRDPKKEWGQEPDCGRFVRSNTTAGPRLGDNAPTRSGLLKARRSLVWDRCLWRHSWSHRSNSAGSSPSPSLPASPRRH